MSYDEIKAAQEEIFRVVNVLRKEGQLEKIMYDMWESGKELWKLVDV